MDEHTKLMDEITILGQKLELASADQSPSLAQFAKALAQAQGAMAHAEKDRKNDFFGQRYATLAAVLDACRTPLAVAEICYLQLVATRATTVVVTTKLVHASGEWVQTVIEFPVAEAFGKNGESRGRTPQTYGSAITYARRYALAAMVGITAADEDDDGEAASGRAIPPGERAAELAKAKAAAIKPATTGPWDRIQALCAAAGKAAKDMPSFVRGVTSKTNRAELTDSDVESVRAALAAVAQKPIIDVKDGETEDAAKARVQS